MDFPSLLQNHLERLGWSRADLLSALQKAGQPRSRATISMWMGKVRPDTEVLPVLATVLGLNGRQAADFYAAAGVPLPSVLQPAEAA